MKIFICFCVIISFMLLSCTNAPSSIQIIQQNGAIHVRIGDTLRLSNLYAVVQGKQITGAYSIGKDGKRYRVMANTVRISANVTKNGKFLVFEMSAGDSSINSGNDFTGIFFDSLPGFKQGVSLWRYKPWNSWTKPIYIENTRQLEDWDIQFFYWQYQDGMYGAMMPLSGHGYRTTLGQHNGAVGAKSACYTAGVPFTGIPQLIVGFGDDPFILYQELYQEGLAYIGKGENLVATKEYPEKLDYIGWCTWNSSDKGTNLSEEHVLESVKSFNDSAFQLGWIIIDDGWFDNTGARLNSFYPDPQKFPNGFKAMNQKLKENYGLKDVGLWHAINGYWNGINPVSELGTRYKNELFSWDQKERPDISGAPIMTYYFIQPGSDSLQSFYNQWHRWMVNEGFTFVKVDNQLVTERMAVNNYPIFDLSEKLHKALNASVFEFFDGAIINCMDMTAEAYLNFGKTAVARAVEDYFPFEEGGIGYTMEKGNAAAHLIMAIYNSLYFGNMVYPDFDMFQSHNPRATFHAIARAINNGPVYLTDKPGRQDFSVLRPLVAENGKLIRADWPLRPTRDCLFQLQSPGIFKAFSASGKTGLLGVWNMSDTNYVTGVARASDVEHIHGQKFLSYEYFSGKYSVVGLNEEIQVSLERMGYALYYFIPIEAGVAPIGLANKYNAPGTINRYKHTGNAIEMATLGGGKLKIWTEQMPKKVTVDGETSGFIFQENMLIFNIPFVKDQINHEIKVLF